MAKDKSTGKTTTTVIYKDGDTVSVFSGFEVRYKITPKYTDAITLH